MIQEKYRVPVGMVYGGAILMGIAFTSWRAAALIVGFVALMHGCILLAERS
jgi:hypothetical protein